jgi:RNA polymerase sigma-70 factor (ECF subfamily)
MNPPARAGNDTARAAIDERLVRALHREANADRWAVSVAAFAAALDASAARALGGEPSTPRDVEKYLRSLHLADLALACACAAGHDGAWEHFVREIRPVLYRSADALDPAGGARDLADSLYGDLYGVSVREGERQSLFRYFHGRSSLATWLRAVLSQRYVDRVRAYRKTDQLPDDDTAAAPMAGAPDPDRDRHVALIGEGMREAMGRLSSRERLRLGCYYAQDLTLAQTGKVLGEHEATVSRQLARTRTTIRQDVERWLRGRGLADAEIAQCVDSVAQDAGTLELACLLGLGRQT